MRRLVIYYIRTVPMFWIHLLNHGKLKREEAEGHAIYVHELELRSKSL
jgi:hypothetical protein